MKGLDKLKTLWSRRAARLALCLLASCVALRALRDAAVISNSVLGFVVFMAAATLLLMYATDCRDKRLNRAAYALGFLYALCVLIGAPLAQTGHFAPVTLLSALGTLAALAALTLLLGAGVVCVFQLLSKLCERSEARAAASDAPKAGALWRDGLIAFAVVLVCWLPVWLAFYPGTFRHDADTQFFTYMDGMMTTHHPLAHTLLMSWLMNLDEAAEDYTSGLALYSGLQMLLMAGMCGYTFAWLKKKGAHIALRLGVAALYALFPLYSLWSFAATKDVLFSGFSLLLVTQLIDLYEERLTWWRGVFFVLSAALMMLFRNNGIYALCLALPFALIFGKERRVRLAVLCACAAAVFALSNAGLIALAEADSGSPVEMMSIPLQQMGRVARDDGEDEALAPLQELYEQPISEVYAPSCADAMKWNLDEDTFFSDPMPYFRLWLELGLKHPVTYLEAFFEQNLNYFCPGAQTEFIPLGINQMDVYPITDESRLPAIRPAYQSYADTLTMGGSLLTRVLSDTALMVWLCVLLLGWAIYRRRKPLVWAALFPIAIVCTCLLGPIASMRYVLAIFYIVPALLCYATTAEKPHKTEGGN